MVGCQTTPTTETVFVERKPVCEPATRPYLPNIKHEELNPLPDETYYKLEDLRDKLMGWALLNEDIIKAVCTPPQKK